MLSKTYDMSVIADLPLSVITDYLLYALEQEKEQKAWQLWKTLYPDMSKKRVKFLSFEAFKKQAFKPIAIVSKKSKQEIEKEMLAIVQGYKQRQVT